jgi:hypothetical protein
LEVLPAAGIEIAIAICTAPLDAISFNRKPSGVQHASASPSGLFDGSISDSLVLRHVCPHFIWAASPAVIGRTRTKFHLFHGRVLYLAARVLSASDRDLQIGTGTGLFGRGLAAA